MEDNIGVVPSEENGNVPIDVPEEQPKEVVAEATPEEVKPTEPELYDLPDGRKVDGKGVLNEYINLQKDYTHKSQTLAELEKGNLQTNTQEKPYQDPNWQPQSYEELLKIAEEKVLTTLQQKEQARVEEEKSRFERVNTQLTELKTIDPSLNENALLLHATKYGFGDLKPAYQNMKDMSELAKKVADTTAKNIAKRNDPVSIVPGATGAKSDPSQFENAAAFLKSLKG